MPSFARDGDVVTGERGVRTMDDVTYQPGNAGFQPSRRGVRFAASPMGVGDVMSSTFSILRSRIGLFIGLALIPQAVTLVGVVALTIPLAIVLVPIFLNAMSGAMPDPAVLLVPIAGFFGGLVVLTILSYVATIKANGMGIAAAQALATGERPSFSQLSARTKGIVGRTVGLILLGLVIWIVVAIIVSIPTVLGMSAMAAAGSNDQGAATAAGAGILVSMLLIGVGSLVAFLITVKLLYLLPVLALEGLGGIAALKRAWHLTDKAYARTLGYWLLAVVVAVAFSSALGIVAQVFTGGVLTLQGNSNNPDAIALPVALASVGIALLQFVVGLILVPFQYVYTTVMYVDQTRRLAVGANPAYPAQTWPPQAPPAQTWPPQAPPSQAPTGYGNPGYGNPGYGPQGQVPPAGPPAS